MLLSLSQMLMLMVTMLGTSFHSPVLLARSYSNNKLLLTKNKPFVFQKLTKCGTDLCETWFLTA